MDLAAGFVVIIISSYPVTIAAYLQRDDFRYVLSLQCIVEILRLASGRGMQLWLRFYIDCRFHF